MPMCICLHIFAISLEMGLVSQRRTANVISAKHYQIPQNWVPHEPNSKTDTVYRKFTRRDSPNQRLWGKGRWKGWTGEIGP